MLSTVKIFSSEKLFEKKDNSNIIVVTIIKKYCLILTIEFYLVRCDPEGCNIPGGLTALLRCASIHCRHQPTRNGSGTETV